MCSALTTSKVASSDDVPRASCASEQSSCKQAGTSCASQSRCCKCNVHARCWHVDLRNARWSQVDHHARPSTSIIPVVTLGQQQLQLYRASFRRRSYSRSTHFRRLPFEGLKPKIGEKRADSKTPGSLAWVNFPNRLKTSGKVHAYFPGKSVYDRFSDLYTIVSPM